MTRGINAAVLEAVARAAGVQALELPPLYDAVDPDALERLFAGVAGETRVGSLCVQFEYAGYVVTVRGDGEVTARRAGPSGPDAASA